MKLTIDNNDGQGAQDYTSYLDHNSLPRIIRKLNTAWKMTLGLAAADAAFVPPASGGRIILQRNDGSKLFTGYLVGAPEQHPLGFGQQARAWRYLLQAQDDSWLLERNAPAVRPSFTWRTAGDALRTITNDVLPGVLDVSGVQDVGNVNQYATNAQKSWGEHAQELATMLRACYVVQDGKLSFQPVGQQSFNITEGDPKFLPEALTISQPDLLRNDVTIVGGLEPKLYVRDYFLGDGITLSFGLSSKPYGASASTLFQEEYAGPILSPTLWEVSDPYHTLSVGMGSLHLNGQATVKYVEQLEISGGARLQHGEIIFNAASQGTIGGIYNGSVADPNCVAGFRITPSGGNSAIQALVNGAPAGNVITTAPGHVYAFATQFIANEAHRVHQSYYSSQHGAGNPRGADGIWAAVRVVLSVHDVDPNNPGTIGAPATVLFDDVLYKAPAFASYAVADGGSLHCDLSFTRVTQLPEVEVRSMVPGQSFRTRLTGAFADGGECYVTAAGNLRFYPPYPPQPNEQIVVAYRSSARAIARVEDTNSIAAHRKGSDNGQRSCVKRLKLPAAPTSVDCENAALAMLDDSTQTAWQGKYQVISDLLPPNDILPAMTVQVNVPSCRAQFSALVREVDVQVVGVDEDRCEYAVSFANEAAAQLSLEFNSVLLPEPLETVFTVSGPSSSLYLPSLTGAQITNSIATEVTVDAGTQPPTGGGIEVRRSDGGWGGGSNGNLAGQFRVRQLHPSSTVTRAGLLPPAVRQFVSAEVLALLSPASPGLSLRMKRICCDQNLQSTLRRTS
jgi:hypothetical protein